MAEQDQKRTMIMEAALKRFKRFGLSKTTMEEIARDLEISKGSLYYYFSDKESIYVAVVECMIAECFLDMSAYVEAAPSTTAIMNRYLELKEKMLLEYHFLFGVNEWIKDVPSTLMRQTIELLQQVEISFLSATISKGVESGELNKDTDTELTAQLLVNVLFGLWVIWCKWQAAGFDPHDREALKCFMAREKQVLTIFFNGLRYRPDINQDRQHVEETITQE